MTSRLAALGVCLLLLAAAGCGGSHLSASAVAAEPELQVFDEPGVGPALTDSSGDTLYLFTTDQQRRVTCTDVCAQTWLPMTVPDGATARAGTGVDPKLIGTVASPAGGRQITYNGWPLYTYSENLTTYSAGGNGTELNGGRWWVISPQGQPLRSAKQ